MNQSHRRSPAPWLRLAILSAFDTKGFGGTEAEFARLLGVSVRAIRPALEAAARRGLIRRRDAGWTLAADEETLLETVLPGDEFREAIRGLRGLEPPSGANVATGALVFALDPEDLPLVRAEIEEFQRRLARIAEAGKKRSRVYASLAVCFPVARAPVTARRGR